MHKTLIAGLCEKDNLKVTRKKYWKKHEILLKKEYFMKRRQCQIKPSGLLNVPHQ